tara:strand:+ start:6244 stop:6618 length:375 start_codon:yes stop_codon:yes gene_type:complete
MLKRMASLGFDLATMPARMTFKGARAVVSMPGDIEHFLREVRTVSDEVAREVQLLLDTVDAQMSEKTAHLDPQQKRRAAQLALNAAEQHLSMAAVNVLRALWLSADADRELTQRERAAVIEADR